MVVCFGAAIVIEGDGIVRGYPVFMLAPISCKTMAVAGPVEEILWQENLQDVPKSQIYTQRQWMRPTVYGEGGYSAPAGASGAARPPRVLPQTVDDSVAAADAVDPDRGSSDAAAAVDDSVAAAAAVAARAKQRLEERSQASSKPDSFLGTSTPRTGSTNVSGKDKLDITPFESFRQPDDGSPQPPEEGQNLWDRTVAGLRGLFNGRNARSRGQGVNLDGKYAPVLQNCMQMILDADYDGLEQAKQHASETLELMANTKSTDVQIFDQFVAALNKFFVATVGVSVDPNDSVSASSLQEVLDSAAIAMSDANRSIDQDTKVSARQKREIASLLAQLKQSRARVAELEAAQHALETFIGNQDDVHRRGVLALNIQRREANIAKRRDLENIQRKLAEIQASLQNERENSAQEKARLQNTLRQTELLLLDEFADFVAQEETIKRLEAGLAAQGEQINAHVSRIAELQEFDSSAESLQPQLRELQEQNANLEEDLERLATALKRERVENETLKGLLRQSQTELGAEQRAEGELEPQIAVLQAELAEQEKRLKAEFEAEAKRLIRRAESDAKNLKDKLQAAKNRFDAAQQAYANTKADLTAKIAGLNARVVGLEQTKGAGTQFEEAQRLTAEISQEFAAARETVARQAEQIQGLKFALQAARTFLASVPPEQDANLLQRKLNALEDVKERMRIALIDKHGELLSLQGEMATLTLKLRMFEEEQPLLRRNYDEMKATVQVLKEDQAAGKQHAENEERLRAQIDRLTADLTALTEQQTSETFTAEELVAQQTKIASLELQLQVTQQNLEEYEKEVVVLRASQAEGPDLQAQVREQQRLLDLADAVKDTAVDKANEDCEEELGELNRQIDRLERLLRECLDRQAQGTNSPEEVALFQAEADRLKAELVELKAELEALGGELQFAQRSQHEAELKVQEAETAKQRVIEDARAQSAALLQEQKHVVAIEGELSAANLKAAAAATKVTKLETEKSALTERLAELDADHERIFHENIEARHALEAGHAASRASGERSVAEDFQDAGGGRHRYGTPTGTNRGIAGLAERAQGVMGVEAFMNYDDNKYDQVAGIPGTRVVNINVKEVFEYYGISDRKGLQRAKGPKFESKRDPPKNVQGRDDVTMLWSMAAFQELLERGNELTLSRESDKSRMISFLAGETRTLAIELPDDSDYELVMAKGQSSRRG